MWRRKNKVLGAMVCALTLSAAAQANALTLADLFLDPAIELELGDVRFTSFRDWQAEGFDGATPIDAAGIDVSLVEMDDALGLRFKSPAFAADDGQSMRFAVVFDVETTQPWTKIRGGSLISEGVSVEGGEFLIRRDDIGEDLTGARKLLAASAVQGDSTNLITRDDSVYRPLQGLVMVRTELVLVSLTQGGAAVESFVQAVRVTEDGHSMPEPGVATLAGVAGLGLLGAAMRRRRGKVKVTR